MNALDWPRKRQAISSSRESQSRGLTESCNLQKIHPFLRNKENSCCTHHSRLRDHSRPPIVSQKNEPFLLTIHAISREKFYTIFRTTAEFERDATTPHGIPYSCFLSVFRVPHSRLTNTETEEKENTAREQHFLSPSCSYSATVTTSLSSSFRLPALWLLHFGSCRESQTSPGDPTPMPSGLAAVPPAQLPTKYRDVIKIALRPRQTRAFILSAVAWHLLLTSALLSTASLSLMSPLTLGVSLLSFAVGVLPLLAKRKRKLSQITTPPARLAPSKAQQLSSALTDPALLPLVYQHVAAFVVLALGYAALLTYRSGGWAPQVWVESHGSLYLNERFLYLIGQSILLGTVYAFLLRGLPSPESVASPLFDPSTLTSDTAVTIKDRVASAFSTRLPRAASVAALTSSTSILIYSIMRIRMWSAILMVLGTRGMMRRLFVPSFRVDFAYVEVSLRTVLFSVAAVCAVETAYLLLDVYLTHPLPAVSKHTKFPNRLLLDGIHEPTLFFSNHAFSELARLSAEDKDIRRSIYNDVGGDVTAWMQIRDRCIRLLEESKVFVERRGQLSSSTPPRTQPSSQQTVEIQQQNNSAKPRPTIWDQLAAGQTPPKESVASATTPAPATNSASKPGPSASALLSVHSVSKAAVSLATLIWKLLPADAKHVVFGPRRQQMLLGESPASQASSIVARDAHRTICAILTLKTLLCHSLDEDAYGSVSKDIQRILSEMVDLELQIRSLGMQLERQAMEIDSKLQKLVDQVTHAQGDKAKQHEAWASHVQLELSQAWAKRGARDMDLSLIAAMRQILNTFEKFDLAFGDDLELKLGECLR